jgi:hypothetical protein
MMHMGEAAMRPNVINEGTGIVVSAELLDDLKHRRGLSEAAISECTRKA